MPFFTSRQVISTTSGFGGTTLDIAITSVNTDNVLMQVQIKDAGAVGAASADPARNSCFFEITSSTNLRLTKSNTGITSDPCQWLVTIFEIDPSYIVSNQYFSNSASSPSGGIISTTVTSVITANTLSFPHYSSDSQSSASFAYLGSSIRMTSDTTLDYRVNSSSGIKNIRGQLIELI